MGRRPDLRSIFAATLILAFSGYDRIVSQTAESQDSLLARIQTIAIAPVATNGNLDISGEVAARLEAALEAVLEDAGFNVVPAYEYMGIWQHIADEFGGVFDPRTGERNDALFELATGRLREDLRLRFDADAVLHPELWEVVVPFSDGVAQWDDRLEAVFGAEGMRGEVRAMSLVIFVEDTVGAELCSNSTGLATIEAWHNDSWLSLHLEGVLAGSRMVAEAAATVLTPIVRARTADSSRTGGDCRQSSAVTQTTRISVLR